MPHKNPSSQPKHANTEPEHNLLTAIDLGSNSFCLLQGVVDGTRVRVKQCLRQSVRLAAGLNADGKLDPDRLKLAIQCLQEFGAFTRNLSSARVRAVATSAVRRMAEPDEFLHLASDALGQPVHLIDGRYEARLIWAGADAALPPSDGERLVIDIGGGSTECIRGQQGTIDALASIDIGCVVSRSQYFADGEITAHRWQHAVASMQEVISAHREALGVGDATEVWATSGSARAIGAIAEALGTAHGDITLEAVADLRQRLLDAGHVERIRLPAMKADSVPVLVGTATVLDALFSSFGFQRMGLCASSMREGILRQLAHGLDNPSTVT